VLSVGASSSSSRRRCCSFVAFSLSKSNRLSCLPTVFKRKKKKKKKNATTAFFPLSKEDKREGKTFSFARALEREIERERERGGGGGRGDESAFDGEKKCPLPKARKTR
jgi:hypothetical protein